MGYTDKAKELTDVALEKVGEIAGMAAELSESAREKAPEYLDRAADLASKAVDAAAAGVDKVTGGRFHDYLDTATGKVGEVLDRDRPDGPGPTGEADSAPRAAADVAGQQQAPITPATTNPDATKGADVTKGPT